MPFHRRARRPGHRGVEARHRQAALFLQLHALALDELGVDERHQAVCGAAAGDIDDEHPQRHTDLRRGQPDAWRGVHRLDHVLHERRDVGADVGDRLGLAVQHLIAEFHDGANHDVSGFRGRATACATLALPVRVPAAQLVDRIAAEPLEHGVRQDEGHHRLANHRCGRHGADIAAFDGGRRPGPGLEVDGAQRRHQRRDRLHRRADAQFLSVGDAALESAGAIGRPHRGDRGSRVDHAAGARQDFVVHLRPSEPGGFGTDPDADRLDGRDRHQRLGEPPVEPAIPLRVAAESGGHASGRHLEHAAERVAGLARGVDGGHHARGRRRVRATRRAVVGQGDDVLEGDAPKASADAAPMATTWLATSMPTWPSSCRASAPAATRAAVSLALARSRTSRMSACPYLIAPARSAWPGRGRVTGARCAPPASAGGCASGCMVNAQFTQSRLSMRHRDRRAGRAAVADAGGDHGGVGFDRHPAAAAVSAAAAAADRASAHRHRSAVRPGAHRR